MRNTRQIVGKYAMRTIIVVSRKTILHAQVQIGGCESCSEDAGIIFEFVLDEVTGREALDTVYLLSEPAKCPACGARVLEDTLVEPVGMERAGRIYPSFIH